MLNGEAIVSMFKEDVEYTDFIAKNDFKYYAVSFDRFGKVGWTSDHISDEDEGYNNAHIIEVLTTKTPKKYLSYLQSILLQQGCFLLDHRRLLHPNMLRSVA